MKDQKYGKYCSHPHHVLNIENDNETGFTCLFKYVKNNEIIDFPNLIIKKCKKVNFKDALIMREKMEIDPFKGNKKKIIFNNKFLTYYCIFIYSWL